MTIKTDHKWKNFKCFYELSPKHKRELDWVKDETASVVVYKGWPFALDEFMRIDAVPDDLKDWHGIKNETFFSGVLIKVSSNGEQYQVGYYYC